MTGQCKFYDASRRYGFIEVPGDRDYFFHASDCMGVTPSSGDPLVFEIGQNAKGPKAVCVRRETTDD